MMQNPSLGPQGTVPYALPAQRLKPATFRVVDTADTEPTHGEPPLLDDVPSEARVLGSLAQPRAATDKPVKVPGKKVETLDFIPGERFRNLVLAGLFAQGGMSLLYEATHPVSLKRLLIKVLKPMYRHEAFSAAQSKLLAEGRLLMAAAGRNPYLVPCHDVGTDEALGPFIVIDKIDGRPLSDHIHNQRGKGSTFAPEVVVTLGITLAEALHQMHEQGAVHRDIKPGNIFMPTVRAGTVQAMLIDWGAAKSPYTANTSLEAMTLGTAAYMAPEQVTRGPITGAIDQYALGFVLFEMLWRHPFLEDHTVDQATLVRRHLGMVPPEPPPSFVSRRLAAILKRTVEKDYRDRYPSLLVLAEELRRWLANPDSLEKRALALVAPMPATIPAKGKSPRIDRTPPAAPTDLPEPARRLGASELSNKASLIVRNGKHAGERYALDGRLVLGRHPGMCHLVLDEEGLSKKHACLEGIVTQPSKPVYSLVDLESTNGSSVGGVRLSDGSDDGLPDALIVSGGGTFVLDSIEISLMPAGRLGPNGEWQNHEQAVLADSAEALRQEQLAKAKAAGQAQAARAQAAAPRPLKQVPRVGMADVWLAPSLIVFHHDQTKRHHLETTGVIGASATRSNLVIANDRVSGSHLRFTQVVGGFGGGVTFLFEDLGSTNGTWKENGKARARVDSVALHSGETLLLGTEVEITLLAPGHIDQASGRFIPCDSHGRPLAVQPPTPKAPAWKQIAIVMIAALSVLAIGLAALALTGGWR